MYNILFALAAYILGSIPSALIVGKVGYQIDIREHGSGNLGATNTFRVLGLKAGTIVTLADIIKGTIATLIPFIFASETHGLFIGLFAVIGHTYPIFAKFKGGKAVATSAGLILGISPLLFGVIIATFLLTLYLCKYVSLSSIITSLVGAILSIIMYDDWILSGVMLLLFLFVTYRHSENIKRIINHTEPKITWM